MSTIVIVGGGLAGAKAAEALRERDFSGDVVLFAGEDHLPYERPPLSKEFMAGEQTLDDFTTHDSDWYRDNRIDVRPGTRISSVNVSAKSVSLPDGSSVSYDKLLLATGSRSRRLDLPHADAEGVHYLRTVDDASALRGALGDDTRLVVIGGGWIGLEVAANARGRGAEVTVLEAESQPLLSVMGAQVAAVFTDLHRSHGVDIRTEVEVTEVVTDDDRATGVRLADGTTVNADVVLVAVGAVANLDLPEAAGLDIGGGGVLTDVGLRTSDPDIFAVGDIANAEHPLLHKRIRTEHWANAQNQPSVAVANMLGDAEEYSNLPYFFTDQYDLGMEYTGSADGYTDVVFRGDVDKLEFVVFWLDGDSRVLAGMQVNIWDQLNAIKALVESRAPVDAASLADPGVDLSRLVS